MTGKTDASAPGRRTILKAAAAGAAGGAAANIWPSGAAEAAAPKKGGTLRVGMPQGSTSDTLDPQTYLDIFMLSLGFATHSTLTEIAPSGELAGDAAKSWSASKDAKTWTFELNKDASFTDGRPVTAQDVITSMNHHRGEESKSAAKSNVEPIKDMRADGKHTVVFEMKAPNADFPYLLADYHLLIMPDKDGEADWRNYIGSGGYTLESFEPGVSAKFKRRNDYWKEGRAHIEEAEYLVLADTNARQTAVTTGEVDMTNRLDIKTVGLLGRRPNLRIEESTGFLHYTAPMDTRLEPYSSNDVRMALKLGVDRQELMDKVLRGHGTLGNDHPIAASVPFHAAGLEHRTYDPDKARHHLKKAGAEGLKISISAAGTAYEGAVDAAILMQEQLKRAGVDLEVVREPDDGYWANVWMKKPWCQCFWGGRPTCDWMFSQAYAADANWNDTFWKHDRFNMLLKAGRGELNASKRAEIYGEMQQIVRDEGGVVVWAFANYIDALNDRVKHGPHTAANWEFDGGRFTERWWLDG